MVRFLLLLLLFTTTQAQPLHILDEADSLLNGKDIEKAELLLTDLLSSHNNNPRVHYLLGKLYLRNNDHKQAIPFLEKAVELQNDRAQYHFLLANAYAMKLSDSGIFSVFGTAKKLRTSLERVLKLNPTHREANLMLYQFHLQVPGLMGGNKDRAKAIASDVLKTDGSLGHFLLALYWEEEKNDPKTEEELLLSIASDSTNVTALNHIGYFYLRQRTPDRSYLYFARAIEIEPESANVYDSMGDCYAAMAKYDSALVCYDKALAKDADFTVSLYNKAKMLEVLGRRAEALLVYRKLAEKFPKDNYGKRALERVKELD